MNKLVPWCACLLSGALEILRLGYDYPGLETVLIRGNAFLFLVLILNPVVLALYNASNLFPVSYIEPCFLLSSPRFVFSLHLVLLAAVNSCQLHNYYYLVLSFLLMYSSSGLSTDVFS